MWSGGESVTRLSRSLWGVDHLKQYGSAVGVQETFWMFGASICGAPVGGLMGKLGSERLLSGYREMDRKSPDGAILASESGNKTLTEILNLFEIEGV
jgi:hypothetical protein